MRLPNIIKKYSFLLINKPTLLNVFIVGVLALIVKLIGFFKEMSVGRTFGLSEIIDTFFIASLIPGFINNVFMSSFQNVFIPNYIVETKQKKDISSFLSACVIMTLCAVIFLSFISYIFSIFFIEDIFKNHSMKYYGLIKTQVLILLPCIFFWSFSSLFAGILDVKGYFRFSTVYPAITSVIFLINIFFFIDYLEWRVLSYSMLIGSFLEFIYLLTILIQKKEIKLSNPDFSSQNVIVMLKQLPSKIASGFLTGSTGFVNQFFAAQLAIGSIAAFNYGQKISSFISSILIIALGNVLLPHFSKIVYEDRLKAYKVLFKFLIYVFFFSFLLSLFLFLFSSDIISLLFEKNNFTERDVVSVSGIQRILLFYVPFYVSSILIIKFLTSINKNGYMFFASVLNLILNVILNSYFVNNYNINGLALATTIVYIVNFLILFLFLRYQYKKDYKG